jgi:nuclear pore complex protein Nup205
LRENRNSMVAVFKRNVKVGGLQDVGTDLSDLVDCFTVLVSATGFLEVSVQGLS